MSVLITVHLHGRTFRGRAGDASRTAWPPSPARLIGALLRGAHALDGADPHQPSGACAQARAAIRSLTSAPAPKIYTPEAPRELARNQTWYARRNAPETLRVSAKEMERYVDLKCAFDVRTMEAKPFTVSLLPDGDTLFYLVDTDPSDSAVAALDAAAQQVPFFGASSDHATISVRAADAGPDDSELTIWVPDDTRRDATVRGWTENTVDWFDARHLLAVEESGASTMLHGDWRVPEISYRKTTVAYQRAGAEPSGGEHALLVIPLPRAETFHRFRELVNSFPESLRTRAFPAVDLSRAGVVRGIGIPEATTADRDAAFAALPDEVLDFEPVAGLRSWAAQTWQGPAPLWVSATPAAAHRDPRIARAQLTHALATRGLTLTAMVRNPTLRFQTRALPAESRFGLWFVTAEPADLDTVGRLPSPVGPIVIGDEKDKGCGVMLPRPRRRA